MKNDKAKSGTHASVRQCVCGCKEPVAGAAMFRPGHDARVKQSFLRVARGEATHTDFQMVDRAWEYLGEAEWAQEFLADVRKALRGGRRGQKRAG